MVSELHAWVGHVNHRCVQLFDVQQVRRLERDSACNMGLFLAQLEHILLTHCYFLVDGVVVEADRHADRCGKR